MPRTELIKNSFVGGEINPNLLGRTDLAKYQVACESIQNFFVKVEGGLHRRWGTNYIVDATGPSRLVPFVISTTQKYILEFGNQVLRFYTNDSQITTTDSHGNTIPYQISTPYPITDVWDIHYAQIISEAYLTHPFHPPMKLIRQADNAWLLIQPNFYAAPAVMQDQDVGTDKGANITISGGGFATATATTPVFIAGDVGKQIVAGTLIGVITGLSGTTATDSVTGATLYPIANYKTIDPADSTTYNFGSWFLRGGPNSYFSPGVWSSATSQWHGSGIYGYGSSIPVRSTTLHPTDSSWQTSSGGSLQNVTYTGGFTDIFRSIDVNSYVPFSGGYGQITSIVSSTQIAFAVITPPTQVEQNAYGNQLIAPAPPGTWAYEVNAFTPTLSGPNNSPNYPHAVCLFGDRLYFAGTMGSTPNTVWGSGVGDYENFALGTLDDSGVRFTINSSSFDHIHWMEVFQGNIIAGSSENEYIINGGTGQVVLSAGAPITPQNINVAKQSSFGVSAVQPLLVDNDMIFIHAVGRRTYRFSFNALSSSFDSVNLNVFNQLFTTGQLKQMAYQAEPNKIIWFVDTNNNLYGLTYEKEQDVWAWHRHFTGVGAGDGVVSVANIRVNQNGTQVDELWMLCQRVRAGNIVWTIEIMQDGLNLDCALVNVFPSPVTMIGGLSYLTGRPVTVVADGVVLPTADPLPDNGGFYYFPSGFSGSNIQAGISYVSYAETVRPEPRSTIQGLIKRWVKIWARLYSSLSLLINDQEIIFRNAGDNIYAATPDLTGDVQVTNLGFSRGGRIRITQNNPLPTHLLALFGIFEISDGI